MVGETIQFQVDVQTTSSTVSTDVTWDIDNTTSATITQDGLLTALADGRVIVTVTSNFDPSVSDTAIIDILLVPEVRSVSVFPSVDSIDISETLQLSVVVDTVGGVTNAVNWSTLNRLVASVSSTGLVTGISKGQVEIQATSVFDPTVNGSAIIVVLEPQVLGIEIIPQVDTLDVGNNLQLLVQVDAVDGASETVQWFSLNQNIAIVSLVGLVTGVNRGSVQIVATSEFDPSVSDTANLFVLSPQVLAVIVTPETARVGKDSTVQLNAEVNVVDNANQAVIWSSANESIARVSITGLVFGVERGQVAIIATSVADSFVSDQAIVTVTNAAILDIQVDPTADSVLVGETIQLSVVVDAVDGATTDVIWTTSNSFATVDTNGFVTGIFRGLVTVTATSNFDPTQSSSAIITVLSPEVTDVTISPRNDMINVSETVQLIATVTALDGADPTVTWQISDPSIATITSVGLVTGVTRGQVTVIATSNFDVNQADTVMVIILDPQVTEIIVTPSTDTLTGVGRFTQLTATVTAIDLADPSVIWSSSNDLIATVDQNGLVTSVDRGSVIITATSVFNPIIFDEASIVVFKPEVTLVDLEPKLDSLEVDSILALTLRVLAADGADTTVIWTSSDPLVAVVDADGVVTGTQRGIVTITAISNFNPTVQGTSVLTVLDPEVTDVTIVPDTVILVLGEAPVQLVAEVTALDGANADVTWGISDEHIVTINSSGQVTAVTRGQAVVTATSVFDNSQSDVSLVQVIDPQVVSVVVTPPTATLFVADSNENTVQLTADVTVIDEASKDVTWISSNPSIATVDMTGLVTALTRGPVTITATSSFDATKNDIAEITIFNPEVTFIDVVPNIDTTSVNGTPLLFEAMVMAFDGADESVTWKSSNASIAFVLSSGVVLGVGVGDVVITATSNFDSTISGSANIAVITPSVLEVVVDPATDSLFVGGLPLQLQANLRFFGSPDLTITWTSSNSAIASVFSTGLVFPNAVGEVTITAISNFDSTISGTAAITVVPQPEVKSVTIDPATASILLDDTLQLNAIVDAVGGASDSVIWSADNSNVAVDENGLITGVQLGSAVVTALSFFDNSRFGTATITVVNKPEVLSITVSPKVDTVVVNGSNLQLTVDIQTQGGASGDVIWRSSDESTVAIDQNGLVTGLTRGAVSIFVSSVFDSTQEDTAMVLSIDPQVLDLSIDPAEDTVLSRESIQLIANVTVQDGASTDVTWSSSDANTAVVLQDGTVLAQGTPGEVTITVISDFDTMQVATASVLVNAVATILDVQVDPAIGSTLVGGTFQLTEVVIEVGGADESVTWSSSNPSIASVDENGLVTGNALGNVIITATSVFDALQRGTADITVDAAPAIIEVTIDPTLDTVNVGEIITLTETVVTEGGADASITWISSDIGIATVDVEGVVSGLSRGTVTITGTSVFDPTQIATATVLVLDPQVLDITVDPTVDTIVFGESIQLTETVTVQDGASSDVTWSSSDINIALVLQDGTVTGQGTSGEVTITVTSDFDTMQVATTSVLVNAVAAILDVQVDPAIGSTLVGGTFQLTEVVTAVSGADESVTWSSSNPSIASVDENGLVTGNALGAVIITATSVFDALQRGTADITVDAAPAIIEVTIDPTLDTVNVGEIITLTETVVTEGGADASITWISSDIGIATVDVEGVVSGLSRGTVTVTGTSVFDPTQIATATVLVLDPQVLDITVDPTVDTIVFGESIQLTETVTVQDGASSDVTWSSSDINIALVLQDGTVTGQGTSGEVTITVTSDFDTMQVATTSVLVNAVAAILDVQVDPAIGSTLVGGTFQLTEVVTAVSGADESVTWSSSNPSIASVDENGLVTGNALGAVIITATSVFDALQRGTADITVDAAPAIIEVTIDPTLDTVNVGEIITLTETVVTEGGADASITWISSDIGIATVDVEGVVSGLSRGTVTITGTSVFEPTQIATATVLVLDPQVLDITVDPTVDTIVFGESIQLTETVTVQDGASSDVTWSSSDINIALVLQDGTVTGQGTSGEVTITVTSDFDTMQVATTSVLVNAVAAILDVQVDPAIGSTLVGGTFQLTEVVTAVSGADESVTWSSSNPSIASVDENGLVTGNALGAVIITATSVFDALQRGTADITVDAAPAIIEVTIDPTLDTVNVGEIITLTETVVTEGGADASITWISSDIGIATVDVEGVVSGAFSRNSNNNRNLSI